MRSQGIEVSLVSPSGNPLPEICAPDGLTVYSVASPGDEFYCQVKLLAVVPDAYHTHVQVELVIDGRTVNYVFACDHAQTVTFKGWPAEPGQLRAFRFAEAPESRNCVASATGVATDDEVGKVVVKLYKAVDVGPRVAGHFACQIEQPAQRHKVPDGKKFFMAPSLAASHGTSKSAVNYSQRMYDRVGKRPWTVIPLRYETASILLLRGVLSRSDPAHRAMLQSDAANDSGDNAAASTSRRDRKPPIVDLTQREAFQQSTLDRHVVCDLTNDAAGAVWTTAPKRRRRV